MLSKILSSGNHGWRFFRAGGFDQVRLETGADIANLEQLDPKLWVALACPVKDLEFDEKTLALIDTDGDGRIRVPEILAAIKFCREQFTTLDVLLLSSDKIALASFNASTDAGKMALASAKEVLKSHGQASASEISLTQVEDVAAIFAKAVFNGDGVFTAEATDSAQTKQVLADILATVGGTADRGGAMGAGAANIDTFFAELVTFEAWSKQAEEQADKVLPLGAKTSAAALAVNAVKVKVDDYFARCRLAAYDARALAALNRNESEYLEFAAKDLTISIEEIKGFPLSRIEAGRALPLTVGVNPAWVDALATLAKDAVEPILGIGKMEMTESEWLQIQAKLDGYIGWAATKPNTKVEALGLERVRAILTSNAKAELAELVVKDKAVEVEFNKIADLGKLVRLHRDLFRLLHNFIAFTDFYSPDHWSVFQAGTLYLDNRSCDLVIRVSDAGKHGAMAHLSKCYLAYCDCTRPNGEKMAVVAVFSGGDSDYLMVGRNGVFFDRKGQDWDATITKIVDNPISIRQAFFSPYKKLVKMIDDMIAKRAAAADAEANAKLSTDAAAAKPPAEPKKFDLGTFALVGMVLGTVTSILLSFLNMGMWIPLILIGIMLAISGPSMLLAALKLRQRTMGPILESNGWAINGRVKVNIPFGGSLTKMPVFPEGAQRSLQDPYKQKTNPLVYVAWLVCIAVVMSLFCVLGYETGVMAKFSKPMEDRMIVLGVPQYLMQKKQKKSDILKELTDARDLVAKEFADAEAKFGAAQATFTVAANGQRVEVTPKNEAKSAEAAAQMAKIKPSLVTAQQRVDNAREAFDKAAAAVAEKIAAKEAYFEPAEKSE